MKNNQYTVYIVKKCITCEKISNFIVSNSIACDVVTMSENIKLPMPLMVYPALLKNDSLLAYGQDIKTFFQQTIER